MGSCRTFGLLAVLALAMAGPALARSDRANPLDEGMPVDRSWSDTPRFAALKAVGPDHVRFSTGERWQVRAEGDPRTLARIRFIIRDGQLTIGRKSGERGELRPATIYVTAPALHRATVGGSGSLAIDRRARKVSAAAPRSGGVSAVLGADPALNPRTFGSAAIACTG